MHCAAGDDGLVARLHAVQVVDVLQIQQVDIDEGGVGKLLRALMQRGQLLFKRLRASKIGHAVLHGHPLADGLLHAEMHVVGDLTDQPVKHDEDEQHDAGLVDHVIPVDVTRPIQRQRGMLKLPSMMNAMRQTRTFLSCPAAYSR